jgi:hypothetical protein
MCGCPRSKSRYLEHEVPDSKLVELRGVDHDPPVGDDEQVFTAVEAFVAGLGRSRRRRRELTRHTRLLKGRLGTVPVTMT